MVKYTRRQRTNDKASLKKPDVDLADTVAVIIDGVFVQLMAKHAITVVEKTISRRFVHKRRICPPIQLRNKTSPTAQMRILENMSLPWNYNHKRKKSQS